MRQPHLHAALVALATGSVCAGTAHAAGFQITEASVAGLGRAFAGAGLVGDDLSAVAYNPAGMTLLSGTAVQGGLTFIDADAYFNGSSTRHVGPLARSESGRDNAGAGAVVPNGYFVTEINDRMRFGLGVNAPFGLRTEYDRDWVGRYHAVESDLTTVDINPSLAFRINEQFSIGIGVSYQYVDATLTQRIPGLRPTGTVPPLVPAADGFGKVEGDDWSWGWNLGAMWELDPDTRLGISFRSKIKQELEGDLETTRKAGTLVNNRPLPADVTVRSDASAEVDLPETVGLMFYKRLDPKWGVAAAARWTNWSRFQELRIESTGFAGGASVTEENWEDTWALSVGVDHYYNEQWTLRAGMAWDQSPVPNSGDRTARIPDSDRFWLSVGASYRPSKNVTVDMGLAHLFFRDADTSDAVSSGPTFGDQLNGSYNSSANLFGVAVQYRF